MQDTHIYQVGYLDVTTEQLTANTMYDITLSQVDSEAHHYQILTEIINNKNEKLQ